MGKHVNVKLIHHNKDDYPHGLVVACDDKGIYMLGTIKKENYYVPWSSISYIAVIVV